MRKLYASLTGLLLVLTAIFGIFARAQKTEKVPPNKGITLEDLGVTEEQKAQIKALWALKRQKHLQAIENLRSLNRLAKDTIVSDEEIRGTLKKFRGELLDQERKTKATEEKLIKDLPPRAQLHLTILGVLENGLVPRRFGAIPQTNEKSVESKSDDYNPRVDKK
jgi:Spy/CpxP family protein refolding chaperone